MSAVYAWQATFILVLLLICKGFSYPPLQCTMDPPIRCAPVGLCNLTAHP